MKKTKKPTTVSEYINAAPPQAKKKLREMRSILKKVVPKAKEVLKWNVPMFEDERILFAYASFKTHLNFMPTPAALKVFKKELSEYKTGKGSVQFPYDKPLPKNIIKKLAAYRAKDVKENDARWM